MRRTCGAAADLGSAEVEVVVPSGAGGDRKDAVPQEEVTLHAVGDYPVRQVG